MRKLLRAVFLALCATMMLAHSEGGCCGSDHHHPTVDGGTDGGADGG